MNKIYEEINKKTNGKYCDVRFAAAEFDGRQATVKVLCKKEDLEKFSALKSELDALVAEQCKFNTPLRTVLTVSELSDGALVDAVTEFIKKFPYISSVADGITASDGCVKLRMHKGMYELAKHDTLPRLEKYLENRFVQPVKVEVETVEFYSEGAEQAPQAPTKNYAVRGLTPVIGSVSADNALSAASVCENAENIAVCGVLTMPTEFLSKSDGVKASRPYEKCILYDGEHTLQCRYFPRDGGTLTDPKLFNRAVCVVGNSELVKGRTGEMSLLIRSVALCDADGLNVLPMPPQPAEYKKIKPQPYEEYVQASLFQTDEKLPDSLRGSFVVFDFETTGLSIFYDKPTEIGAVKIVDGVITETFTTLIDPQRPIPPEVSEKTGITDDMVHGKPKINEVLPDFFKFSYGCALVGHNVAFDFPFLLKFGNRFGYTFGDRKTFDTLGMAPRAIPGIDNLTLDNVLGKLGLVNDNAHRALSDATMTAKAFIAMSKII